MCAILYDITCPIGSRHRLYIGTRTGTKQVMVPESSRGNFPVAKSHVTMNTTVNQEGISTDILSYVISHQKVVKILVQLPAMDPNRWADWNPKERIRVHSGTENWYKIGPCSPAPWLCNHYISRAHHTAKYVDSSWLIQDVMQLDDDV